jgi:peptide chain release factor subunit 1
MTETSSVALHKLKKELEVLESKKGKGTELITLYIPHEKNLSDVMAQMREEYSQATNIKSTRTRKNVLSALEVIMQRLKLIKDVPDNGLVLLVGTIPRGIKDKIEVYMLDPPEKITTYTYHCASQFLLEPIKDMLEEKETYGLLVVDRGEATVGLLKGKHIEVVRRINSNVPRKHGRGGQSQRRFERLIEIAAHEYFKRVAKYASEVFLNTPDLKGVLIGGPGPTKEFFVKEGYLHPGVRNKIIATVDTSYTDDFGIRELVENASETFKDLEVTKEKKLVQHFMKEVVKDAGLAAYGEKEVKEYLAQGAVDTVLISEDVDSYRITVECPSCGYQGERTVLSLKSYSQACPKCGEALEVQKYRTTLDEFQKLADATGARVEIISNETEEGQQLKAFGGIAAILRFRPGG